MATPERCPVTGDVIVIQELSKDGSSMQCLIRTRFWTTGVISGKKKAQDWVGKHCKDADTFLDGAVTITREMEIPPNSDILPYLFIENPKRGWKALVRSLKKDEVWYALTRRPEYAPTKLEVVRHEDDALTKTDDALSGLETDGGDPELEELLDHAKSIKS
jgi:hypothetical protein